MKFINLATLALEMMFAPRSTEMGSMVDILGVGVLIRGESGIGKSESVLALLERGYSRSPTMSPASPWWMAGTSSAPVPS